jgi:hypothetical protein
MPYIVKSSLDIGGKTIPWNEQEVNKLIKEKKEVLEAKKTETEQVSEQVSEQDARKEENAPNEKQDTFMRLKKGKKKDKVGDE